MEFINEDTSIYPHTNATLFLTASSNFFAVVLSSSSSTKAAIAGSY